MIFAVFGRWFISYRPYYKLKKF